MGRVKIQIRKLEDRTQRNIAFAKRKNGLLKKAYELYTLCNVQIALILFSPSGKLFLFDAKTRIEETIQKYLDLPIRASLNNEPFIRRWVDEMRLKSKYCDPYLREIFDGEVLSQYQEIEDEIEKCKVELAEVEQKLGYVLNPPTQWESTDEIKHQEKLLQKILDQIQSHKQYLEAENNVVDVPNPASGVYLGDIVNGV